MPAFERNVEVCDFCYSYHQFYMPDHPFNFAKKEGVSKCTLCKEHNVMCLDCCEQSRNELQGSVLFNLGLVVCRSCLVNIRRVTDMQEKLELIAKKRIEELKSTIRENAYFLTQSLQGQM